jgi:hypothetical protein
VQARVSEWSLSTLLSPIPKFQHALLLLKVLWARERAPTPSSSAVFYLDSPLSLSRSWECVKLNAAVMETHWIHIYVVHMIWRIRHIDKDEWWWMDIGGQMLVDGCLWTNICRQMLVGGRGQMDGTRQNRTSIKRNCDGWWRWRTTTVMDGKRLQTITMTNGDGDYDSDNDSDGDEWWLGQRQQWCCRVIHVHKLYDDGV